MLEYSLACFFQEKGPALFPRTSGRRIKTGIIMRYCNSKKLDMGDLHWQGFKLAYAFCLHKRGFRSPQLRFIPSPLSIATFHLPPDPHPLQHRKHLLYPFYLGENIPFFHPTMSTTEQEEQLSLPLTDRSAWRDTTIYASENRDKVLGGLCATEGITKANVYSMLEIFCFFTDTFTLHDNDGQLVERDGQKLQPGNYYIATNGRSFPHGSVPKFLVPGLVSHIKGLLHQL